MGALSKQPPYLFKVSREKIGLVHNGGATVRVNPRDEYSLDPGGGMGVFAQWDAEVRDGCVRLKSVRTGKFIRIHPHKSTVKVDCGGTGGKWCWFRIYETDRIREGFVKLESKELKGQWLAIRPDGSSLAIGRGGPFCVMRGIRLSLPPPGPVITMGGAGPVPMVGMPGEHGVLAPAHPIPVRPVGMIPGEREETVLVVPAAPVVPMVVPVAAPVKKVESEAAERRMDYAWKVSRKTVVITHKLSKTLRVNPKNLGRLDINGGYGKFARFEVEILDGGKKCRMKSQYTGKYVRIHGDKVDVEGAGGKWCVFKVHRDGHKVKLESKEISGKYLAVKKDGSGIKIGGGGKWCEMHAFRFD